MTLAETKFTDARSRNVSLYDATKSKRTVGRPQKDKFPVFIKVGTGPTQRLEGQDIWTIRATVGKNIQVALPEPAGFKWKVVRLGNDDKVKVSLEESKTGQSKMLPDLREFDLSLLALPQSVSTILFTLSNSEGQIIAKRELSFIK